MPFIRRFILALLATALLGSGCTDSPSSSESTHQPASNLASASIVSNTSTPTEQDLKGRIFNLFADIDSKNFSKAYTYFSPSFQASHPFTTWSNGYKNTLDHHIDSVTCSRDACEAVFTATELTEQNLRKQQYTISYAFVYTSNLEPKIDYGTLISSSTTEVVRSFAPLDTPSPQAVDNVTVPLVPVAPAVHAVPINTAPAPSVPVQRTCCKYGSKGKACGDSCISRSYTCHKGPGCACDL